jgi:hypothetical protein
MAHIAAAKSTDLAGTGDLNMSNNNNNIVGHSTANQIVGKLTINKTNFNKTMTQGFGPATDKRDSNPKPKG